MALPLLCFSGKYAGRGGRAEDGGGRCMLACERMDDNNGRGPRKDCIDDGEAYIPRPTTFSGRFGSRLVTDSSYDDTSVLDDEVVDDRHLNDISENIGFVRYMEVFCGNTSGKTGVSAATPNKWHLKGS